MLSSVTPPHRPHMHAELPARRTIGAIAAARRQLRTSRVRLASVGVALLAQLPACNSLDSKGLSVESGVPMVLVSPSAASVAIGGTLQLSAEVRSAGGAVNSRAPVTWSNARSSVTSVSATGLVTGVGTGIDTITAQSMGQVGRAEVIVQAATEATADVLMRVNTSERFPISRFIYGLNFLPDGWEGVDVPRGITLSRIGGNRLTAYNWETNWSNAGSDWRFQNDDYLSSSSKAGEAIRSRITAAQDRGAAAMVTIPMMGYVAGNKLGIPLDTLASTRAQRLAQHFKVSKAAKGAPFSLNPDAGDAYVYQDEFVNWTEQSFPAAKSDALRPIFYSLDNESDSWRYTHGEIDGSLPTYDGFIDRTIEYAAAAKAVAPHAVLFGPAVATYAGVLTLGRYPAPDPRYPVWQSDPFIKVYLQRLRTAETTQGRRLVDVFDLHWYPQNGTSRGSLLNDYDTQDAEMVQARVQAPRSLWDPTFDEKSWVSGNTGGPIRLIPRLREQIASYYPGTKIGITEYFFGRAGDISGGIAQADALGIFGREGVYAAALWPTGSPPAYGNNVANTYAYAMGAFRMFLDFDGQGGRFGDIGVSATTPDVASQSVYASLDANGRVVVVAINKKTTSQTARIVITHDTPLRTVHAYVMRDGTPRPVQIADPRVDDTGAVFWTMPPLSVTTLVLSP